MSRMFYVRRDREVSGPVTAQQLQEMAADGTLSRSDYVRAADQDKWYVAGRVKGLFVDTVQSGHPTRRQTPAPRENSAGSLALPTEGMIDIEGFERERKRWRAARWKRLTLWVGATAGVAIISVVVILPPMRSARAPSTAETVSRQQRQESDLDLPRNLVDRILAIGNPALSESIRDEWLGQTNSSRDHWEQMIRMGERMAELDYEVTLQRLPYLVAGGVSHINVPDCHPYEMEWRLDGVGGTGRNDVPVSFLKTRYDGPFKHEMAIAAVKEFKRISQEDIDTFKVTTAMKDAETSFKRIRRLKPSDWGSWFAVSKLPDQESPENVMGEYAIRVVIQEWEREEYVREDGSSKILIYFVYLPPNRKVDLTEVRGGGFQLLKARD
jgi:hypothetical protein